MCHGKKERRRIITRIAMYHPTPLFWYLGFHGNAILNFINTPKAPTHYGEYSYYVSWKKSKLFLNPWQLRQFVLPIPILLAYLVPLDVDVIGNITAKLCEVWSEFNIFAPWLPWQQPPFWICSTPKSCHTLRWIFLQSFMKFDERNPYVF